MNDYDNGDHLCDGDDTIGGSDYDAAGGDDDTASVNHDDDAADNDGRWWC